MRKDQNYHYFTSSEVQLLKILEDDIRIVLKCNKENEAPHQRLREWAVYLSFINRKHGDKNNVQATKTMP